MMSSGPSGLHCEEEAVVGLRKLEENVDSYIDVLQKGESPVMKS